MQSCVCVFAGVCVSVCVCVRVDVLWCIASHVLLWFLFRCEAYQGPCEGVRLPQGQSGQVRPKWPYYVQLLCGREYCGQSWGRGGGGGRQWWR